MLLAYASKCPINCQQWLEFKLAPTLATLVPRLVSNPHILFSLLFPRPNHEAGQVPEQLECPVPIHSPYDQLLTIAKPRPGEIWISGI